MGAGLAVLLLLVIAGYGCFRWYVTMKAEEYPMWRVDPEKYEADQTSGSAKKKRKLLRGDYDYEELDKEQENW